MAAANEAFPEVVIQHEDFYSEAAFDFLERYQSKYRMFNDDIQGTGSVILGGFLAAARQSSKASGKPLKDHRVVFLGGGSAAVGVAKEMMNFFKLEGLSEQEARERFWLIDTKVSLPYYFPRSKLTIRVSSPLRVPMSFLASLPRIKSTSSETTPTARSTDPSPKSLNTSSRPRLSVCRLLSVLSRNRSSAAWPLSTPPPSSSRYLTPPPSVSCHSPTLSNGPTVQSSSLPDPRTPHKNSTVRCVNLDKETISSFSPVSASEPLLVEPPKSPTR